MFANANIRQFARAWGRRLILYFIGITSATGALVMLLGAFLVISGVLEW